MRAFEFLIEDKKHKDIITKDIKFLGNLFKKHGHELRLVGGAVRDVVLGKQPKDIDFATDATPDEMTKFLEKSKIKVVPTGVEHGTITAVYNNEPYEITTLRADKETDGRHADVEFVRSWEQDAKRRDLTYNAMSMSMDGEVHDYYNGMDDLQNKVSKFVGDPEERIKEDYLRILRYFRFQSRLDKPSFDKDTLAAIKKTASGLKKISVERVWQEVSKLLTGQNVVDTLTAMSKTGVANAIGLKVNNVNAVKDTKDPLIALVQLGNEGDIASRWKMSNPEGQTIKFLVKHKDNTLDQNKVEDMLADGISRNLITSLAKMQGKGNLDIDSDIPAFPVDGQDLISIGMKPGPEIGNALNTLKADWKNSRFKLTKDELLQRIKK